MKWKLVAFVGLVACGSGVWGGRVRDDGGRGRDGAVVATGGMVCGMVAPTATKRKLKRKQNARKGNWNIECRDVVMQRGGWSRLLRKLMAARCSGRAS